MGVLPGVLREGWGDEGQGVSLWNAFESKQRHEHTCKFLMKYIEDTGAHAVMLVVPKAKVKFPALWDKPKEPWGFQEDGYLIQLEAKDGQDRAMWFVEAVDGQEGTAHQLNMEAWKLLPPVFVSATPAPKKV